MLICLFSGIQELVHVSRTCACHSFDDEKVYHGVMHWVMSQRSRKLIECPGNGLRSAFFSMGKWRSFLESTYYMLRGYLLGELGPMPRDKKDMILDDYEKGCAHVDFEMGVKFICWEQVPLVVHAINWPNAAEAAAKVSEGFAMYEVTKDNPRHSEAAQDYFGTGEKAKELQKFVDTMG